MMKREENIIVAKADRFTDRIILLYKYLKNSKNEGIISKQILRSGTSIGAMIAESQSAQSPADFVNKLEIALKEAKETNYWLDKLRTGEFIDEKGHSSMKSDNTEIIRILSKIVITKKRNMGIIQPTK